MSADRPPDQRRWRIDDLAHESGVSVDTIRYYRREGLLPPATQVGRTKWYGRQHLERLNQIRDLQARRFSLAAIRALLEAERPGLIEGIFEDEPGVGRSYGLDELLARSGTPRELAEALREAGVLRDPAEVGRDHYEALDLDLLTAVADLRELGLPDHVIVALARIYATGVESMQHQVLAVFRGVGAEWDPDELARFQQHATARAGDLLPRVQRMVAYIQQRTLQRLTLRAIDADAGDEEAGDEG